MARTLAITKRVDLSDVGEGWEGCFALVTPSSYQDYAEILSLKMDTSEDQLASAMAGVAFAKKHFVRGKVRILNDQGEEELVDMEADDIDTNREIADRLLAAVTGVIKNPKALSTPSPVTSETEPDSSEPSTSGNNTKTS